jgi:hypothetical protein
VKIPSPDYACGAVAVQGSLQIAREGAQSALVLAAIGTGDGGHMETIPGMVSLKDYAAHIVDPTQLVAVTARVESDKPPLDAIA